MLKTKSEKEISKIGIGTWTINKENFNNEVEALKYYYSNGINFIDVVLAYDNGKVVDVIAEFLKNVKREDIFINAFITYGCDNISDISKQIDFYLEKLSTDYLDCVTLHGLDAINFSLEDYSKEIKRLKQTNKFNYIGYSNLSPDQLEILKDEVELFEGMYNLECKINEDNNILKICRDNNIPFFAYQPLRRNKTSKQNYEVLVELSQKYNKTHNQIILNWLIKHKFISVLVKSSNIDHIQENITSLSFTMENNDYKKLDDFRNIEFDNLQVCYSNEEGKIRIDQIPNQHIGIL